MTKDQEKVWIILSKGGPPCPFQTRGNLRGGLLTYQNINMRTTKTKYINELLNTENDHLKKLNEIVVQSLEQEKLLLQNINQPSDNQLTFGQRLADRVARFGGSWKFIIW